jgi:hypothetical protein
LEEHCEPHYRGGWAGPGAALVLIAIGLIVLAWLEVGLMNTLMHG